MEELGVIVIERSQPKDVKQKENVNWKVVYKGKGR